MVEDAWTLLGSRQVADHRIFRIRNDFYRFEPTAAERDFVVLESPDWVNVVPITDDGRVVLIHQYRHGIREVCLEIPGGIIDPHESPQEAAVRELREETGFAAERVRPLGRVAANPAFQNNYQHCFVAEGCRRTGSPRLDPFEQIDVVLVPLANVPDLIRAGQMSHALVVIAFALLGILGPDSTAHPRV